MTCQELVELVTDYLDGGLDADARAEFDAHLLADVNAPGGLGVLFELVRTLNAAIDAGEVGTGDVPAIRAAFDHFDLVLGFIGMRRAEDAAPPVPVEEIERELKAES